MAWTEQQQIACLGVTQARLDAETADQQKRWGYGPLWLAFSTLSDVQEMIERGLTEEARQAINRAKYLMEPAVTAERQGGR